MSEMWEPKSKMFVVLSILGGLICIFGMIESNPILGWVAGAGWILGGIVGHIIAKKLK